MSPEVDPEADAEDLRERVNLFVQRNFPQIAMHGGSYAVRDVDPGRGEVTVALGGACSGCGISPMTVQALKTRLVREVPEIRTVHAETAGERRGPRLGDSDAPF